MTIALAAVDEQRPARLVMVLIISAISVSMWSVLNVLTTLLDPVWLISVLLVVMRLVQTLVLAVKTLDVLMKMNYVKHVIQTVAHVQPVKQVTLLHVLLVQQVLGTQVQTLILSVLMTVQLDSQITVLPLVRHLQTN